MLDRSQWIDGDRAFRVRINATAGPDDMHRHILAIERETRKRVLTEVEAAFAMLADFSSTGEMLSPERDILEDIRERLEG